MPICKEEDGLSLVIDILLPIWVKTQDRMDNGEVLIHYLAWEKVRVREKFKIEMGGGSLCTLDELTLARYLVSQS